MINTAGYPLKGLDKESRIFFMTRDADNCGPIFVSLKAFNNENITTTTNTPV